MHFFFVYFTLFFYSTPLLSFILYYKGLNYYLAGNEVTETSQQVRKEEEETEKWSWDLFLVGRGRGNIAKSCVHNFCSTLWIRLYIIVLGRPLSLIKGELDRSPTLFSPFLLNTPVSTYVLHPEHCIQIHHKFWDDLLLILWVAGIAKLWPWYWESDQWIIPILSNSSNLFSSITKRKILVAQNFEMICLFP